MIVGRIKTTQGLTGDAEFNTQARAGDYIYYLTSEKQKVMCQIMSLKTSPMKGYNGSFRILEFDCEPPKPYSELFTLISRLDAGHIEIGKTPKGQTVKLRLNPFFLHVLIPGTTQMGKTHAMIVLAEEFLKRRVPCLMLDPQGEMPHLNEYSPDAYVTEELKFEDLMGFLKQKKTVVYNLLGLSSKVKAKRAYEILSQLMAEKEKDYKQAENDVNLLENPPVLIGIDEAEIFAPQIGANDLACKEAIVDIIKRGSKFGIGLIIATQRPPQLDLEIRSQCHSAIIFHIYDDGSRKVLRMLPYMSSIEINRVRNFNRGKCIIVGQLVEHPTIVNIRDISIQRAKNVNYEEILKLPKIKPAQDEMMEFLAEETGKAELAVTNIGAAVSVSMLCPDCKKPLVYEKGRYVCKTNKCKVMEVKAGKIIRSSL